jgi:hypothetical protein
MQLQQTLDELCALACSITNAARISVGYRDNELKQVHVIAQSSGRPRKLAWRHRVPLVGQNTNFLLVPDVTKVSAFDGHAIFEDMPTLRSIAAYIIGNVGSREYLFSIWNPPKEFFDGAISHAAIDHLVSIFNEILIGNNNDDAPLVEISPDKPIDRSSSQVLVGTSSTSARFLLDTLTQKQRLLARNGCSYLALTSWRKDLKQYQIGALAALKAMPSTPCEEKIAAEICTGIRRVYGEAFQYIVPIPGGSSGQSESFSVRIARIAARNLNTGFADILLPQEVKIGKSHPSKSAKLEPYRIRGDISGNVLILDDVATSGRHIELASHAIRPLSTYCAAVVWIAV